jgi:hypothetical protein
MHFHVELHDLVEFEGTDAAADGHAKCVAEEVDGMVIGEKLRIFREHRTLFGLLDIGFELYDSVPTGMGRDRSAFSAYRGITA